MTTEVTTNHRKCSVGCEGVKTTFYLQRLADNDPGKYAVLCAEHARSRRALGYRLSPVRKSKGTY